MFQAKKFEPSDEFPAGQFFSGLARAPRFPPAQGKRTHTIELTMVQLPEDDELQSRLSKFDVIEAFGAETSNLFNIGFQSYPRKKFARKLRQVSVCCINRLLAVARSATKTQKFCSSLKMCWCIF